MPVILVKQNAMSKLIYLDEDYELCESCICESSPDHRGRTYEDPAILISFAGEEPEPVPLSQKLLGVLRGFYGFSDTYDFLDYFDPNDFDPSEFMIVEAEGGEFGNYPFTTSERWLTISKSMDGRTSINLREAAELLRSDRR